MRLAPTAAGRNLAWRYQHLQLHRADGVFDRLTEQQAEQLLHLMEILAADPGPEHTNEHANELPSETHHPDHARPSDGRKQEVRA